MKMRQVLFRCLAGMVLVFLAIIVALTTGLMDQVEAAFISPLTANYTFPTRTVTINGITKQLSVSVREQVFRPNTVPSTGEFININPITGLGPGGNPLTFFYKDPAGVGTNDFTYALVVVNNATSNIPVYNFQLGTCAETKITSVGYFPSFTRPNPQTGVYDANGQISFAFPDNTLNGGNDNTIAPGKTSAIIFFTSPNPPSTVGIAALGGSQEDTLSVDSSPNRPIYSACPCAITIDKKIGCTLAGVSDNPLTSVQGEQLYYQLVVKNTGRTPISNIVITDPLFGGNLNAKFTVNNNPFTGSLAVGQQAIAAIPTTANASVVNTANVAGEYLIQTPAGGSTGQSYAVSESPNSIVNDSTSLTVVPAPGVTSQIAIFPLNFTTLPQTLNFTLTATNAMLSNDPNASELIELNVDSKLKDILVNGKPGLTISAPPAFPTASVLIKKGDLTQVQFSITVNSVDGWKALMNAGMINQASFSMTANAAVPGIVGTACGVSSATTLSSVTTSFTPPATMSLVKLVACDAGNGIPADSDFSPGSMVFKNAKLYYRYKIKNTSLLDDLSSVSINDPALSPNPIVVGTLLAGEEKIFNFPVTITQSVGLIPGMATATGTANSGNVTATANADVSVIDPKISAQKLVNGGSSVNNYNIGDQLTFNLTAKNEAGGGSALNLTIDDVLLKNIPGVIVKDGNAPVNLPYTFTNVQPGQSVSLIATVTITTPAQFFALSNNQNILKNVIDVSATIPGGVQFCSFGSSTSPASLKASAEVSVIYNPPVNPADVCILLDCSPNCPVPSIFDTALANSNASDDKPGSLLLYNIYTSSSQFPNEQNSTITLTNRGPKTVFSHLFLVDGSTCTVADFSVCLSPAQTSAFNASELDPGVTGYIIAVAVDENGTPISFNHLIGSVKVKFKSGQAAILNAVAFSALYPAYQTLPGFIPGSTSAELKLDGVQYNLAPQYVAVDNFFSPKDNNSTMLILNPVGGDLNTSDKVATLSSITGLVYNDREKNFSFNTNLNSCQLLDTLSDRFPRIPLSLSKIVSSGSSGFIRLWESTGLAMTGAVINFTPNSQTSSRAFNQGHNLHNLNFTNQAKYIIPIFRPH